MQKSRNESAEHHEAKALLRRFFLSQGFPFVETEVANCDVLVVGKNIELAVEFERTPVNVIRNIMRNFSNGASFVLVVVPDFRMVANVSLVIRNDLQIQFYDRVGIVTLSALQFFVKQQQNKN